MRISKQTNDAVRVLVFLARSETELHAITDIAKACDVTKFNAFKLVPVLVKAGFLVTERGRGGGVKLALSPAEISVGAVVRELEVLHRSAETAGVLDNMVDDAFEAFLQILDENTIADLAKETSASRGSAKERAADKSS